MKKALLILSLLAITFNVSVAQSSLKSNRAKGHLKWYTMEQALAMSKTQNKKILVDFYTDWCGWCKRMDKTTYEDAEVVKLINKHFIPVKFNAEREKDIMFKGKNYSMKQTGVRKTHELAITLLSGKLGYPTTTILDKNHNMIQNLPGYLKTEDMIIITKYFGNDFHRKMPFPEYKQQQMQLMKGK